VTDGRSAPDPSELVYVSRPSWAPVLAAVGLAGVLVGLFAGWPYAVAGGILGLAALWSWVRRAREEIGRLPREQRVSAAVLPAIPLRRRPDEES
jgi:hypothetical protein